MSGRSKPADPDVRLSKALSWILRHGAEKEGFTLMKGGFLHVEDILKKSKFRQFSVADIQRIVENNDKKRFALDTDSETGKLKIRANQGHTLQVEELNLTPIVDAAMFPAVIHGTDRQAFQFIARQGLKRMRRNHIHFAAGEPGENGVISGMRKSCSVIIFIDLIKALEDGYEFYLSANRVILCAGNKEGILPTTYFQKVLDRTSREQLPFEQNQASSSLDSLQDPPAASSASAAISAEELADEFEDKKKRRGKKKVDKS